MWGKWTLQTGFYLVRFSLSIFWSKFTNNWIRFDLVLMVGVCVRQLMLAVCVVCLTYFVSLWLWSRCHIYKSNNTKYVYNSCHNLAFSKQPLQKTHSILLFSEINPESRLISSYSKWHLNDSLTVTQVCSHRNLRLYLHFLCAFFKYKTLCSKSCCQTGFASSWDELSLILILSLCRKPDAAVASIHGTNHLSTCCFLDFMYFYAHDILWHTCLSVSIIQYLINRWTDSNESLR